MLQFSSKSSIDWRLCCPRSWNHGLTNQEPVGGEGIGVEIGEKVIGRNKWGIQHPLNHIWLLGGIERDGQRKFLLQW